MATIASLIVRVAADVSELKTNMEKAESFITKTAKTLAAAWVVDKILEAANAAVQFASRMEDVSARTGMSTRALQEFSFAGKLVGVSLESVVSATGSLQKNLALGGDSVVGALGMLGLKLNEIKAMRPEDQFTTIAAKLRDVKNQSDFARIGAELMGRGFLETAPLIRSNLQEIAAEAHRLGVILSSEDLKALDGLGDAMDKLNMAGQAALAQALIPMVPALTDLAGVVKHLPAAIDAVVLGFDAIVFAGAKIIPVIAPIAIAFLKLQQLKDPFNWSGVDQHIEEWKTMLALAPEVAAAVVAIDRSHKGAADRAKEHAAAIPSLTFNYGAAAEAAKGVADAVAKLNKETHDFYFDMRMWGLQQLREMTAEVQKEMAAQRDAVAAAQMEILGLMNASNAAKRVEALGGATSLDVQLEALAQAHQANLMRIEQAGRAASSLGSKTWAAEAAVLMDEAERSFQQVWQALVTESAKAGPAASGVLQRVGFDARLAAGEVWGLVQGFQTLGGYGVGYFGGGYQTAAAQSQSMPQLAQGGIGNFGAGTMAMLHGREAIIPLDKGGGVVGGTTINVYVTGGEDPRRAGKQIGDAITAELRARGQRI